MSHESMWVYDDLRYAGRNGTGKCYGLSLQQCERRGVKYINLQPVNSKNKIANCYIEFPISKIDDLIQILKEIQCSAQKQ